MEAVNFLASNWWAFALISVGAAIVGSILQLKVASGAKTFSVSSRPCDESRHFGVAGFDTPIVATEGVKKTMSRMILPMIFYVVGTVGCGICAAIGLVITILDHYKG